MRHEPACVHLPALLFSRVLSLSSWSLAVIREGEGAVRPGVASLAARLGAAARLEAASPAGQLAAARLEAARPAGQRAAVRQAAPLAVV